MKSFVVENLKIWKENRKENGTVGWKWRTEHEFNAKFENVDLLVKWEISKAKSENGL